MNSAPHSAHHRCILPSLHAFDPASFSSAHKHQEKVVSYFLLLHQKVSPKRSCSDLQFLHRTPCRPDTLTDILFDQLEEKQRQKETVRKMQADGIPLTKIADYLGLSQYQLKKIIGNLEGQKEQAD